MYKYHYTFSQLFIQSSPVQTTDAPELSSMFKSKSRPFQPELQGCPRFSMLQRVRIKRNLHWQ